MSERSANEARRKKLGLPPVIDRRNLAIQVLDDRRPLKLDRHERLLIARLLDPELVACITKHNKKADRPRSTAAALLADEVAETYFVHRALWPRDKHKETVLPKLAKCFGVSASLVEKAVRRTAPARRAEMKALAAATAKRYTAWLATPRGIEAMAEDERVRALMMAKRRESQRLQAYGRTK